jgi:YbbR domain-containing protein
MKLSALRPRRTPSPSPEPSPPGGRGLLQWREWLRFPRPGDLRGTLRQNRGMKIVSLLLAIFLWFSINVSERDAERICELPIFVRKLQRGLVVTNPPVKPVTVTLRGPRTILDGVDEHKAHVALDLTTAEPGDLRLELTADMVRPDLPRRLKATRIEPARLKLRVERLVRRTLPVRIDLAGMPAFGYTVVESHVTPDKIEVSGPASRVDEIKEIATEPIDLRGIKELPQRSVLMSWAGDFVTFTPDHVTVSVTFEEVMVSREYRHVEVRVLGAEGNQAQLTPAFVDLTVRGPQRLLHNYKIDDGSPYVDATSLPPGTHKVSTRIDLPPALELMRRQPEVLQLQLGPRGKR